MKTNNSFDYKESLKRNGKLVFRNAKKDAVAYVIGCTIATVLSTGIEAFCASKANKKGGTNK